MARARIMHRTPQVSAKWEHTGGAQLRTSALKRGSQVVALQHLQLLQNVLFGVLGRHLQVGDQRPNHVAGSARRSSSGICITECVAWATHTVPGLTHSSVPSTTRGSRVHMATRWHGPLEGGFSFTTPVVFRFHVGLCQGGKK